MIYYSSNRPAESRAEFKTAFTLIELVLVVTLLSVVSLTMYAVFNSGIKIWQKINRQLPYEDVAIFLDKFSHDLRNSFKSSAIIFSGRQENLEFATMVNSRRLQKTTVGRAAYFYDSQAMALSRQLDDYSRVSGGSDAGVIQSLQNVKSLKFQYYFFDAETKQYFWRQEYAGDSLPLAVSIELEVQDGSQTHNFLQRINIPSAG